MEAGAAPGVPRPAVAAVAAASVGAAAIHAVVIPEHLEEWWAFGLFFLVTGVVQLVWAVMVVRSPSRSVIWLGVLGNASIVVLWVVTRTVGTLVGPEPHIPEPVGLADALATAFELFIVVTGARLVMEERTRQRVARCP
jgi:predicted branched-subunit amino acid permease